MTTINLTDDRIDQLCTTYIPSGSQYNLAKADQLERARSGQPLGISYEEAVRLCTRYDGLAKVTDLTSLTALEEAMGLK